jgi:hypothetical protein
VGTWNGSQSIHRIRLSVGSKYVLEELVREISVGEMELNAVESGTVDGSVLAAVCVPLDVGL